MAKKTKFIKTTPVGTASFPWLTKADTKFDADGTYKTDLIFDEDEITELAEEMQVFLDAAFDEYYENAKPAVQKGMSKVETLKPVLDAEGNETGQVFLRFKLNALVKPKEGEPFEQSPNAFDAAGDPLEEGVAVYGGSRIKVNFEAVPYMSAKDKVVGLTLRLRAFQVKELCTSSGGTSEAYGFDREERKPAMEADDTPAPAKKAKATKDKPTDGDDDDF